MCKKFLLSCFLLFLSAVHMDWALTQNYPSFLYSANKSIIVFSFVRSSIHPYVRHTYVNFDISGMPSHIVMKFCTLTHYIKDKTLQPKIGFLGNVCLSEKT